MKTPERQQEFNENRATAFDSQKLEFREMVRAFHKAGIELNAPLLERIAKDPILKNVQIIAEDWDAAVARGRGIVFGRSTNLPPEPEIECHPSGSKNDPSTVADGADGEAKVKSFPAGLVRIAA
jgi:hypothetical protein